jgi:hypothetical protein
MTLADFAGMMEVDDSATAATSEIVDHRAGEAACESPQLTGTLDCEMRQQGFIVFSTSSSETVAKELA